MSDNRWQKLETIHIIYAKGSHGFPKKAREYYFEGVSVND